MSARPSELAIVLAAVAAANGNYVAVAADGWVTADEVRSRLAALGFDVSTQQAAAWLGRMSRVDQPWVEARQAHGYREYRVAVSGATDVHNRFRGIALRTPWLPTYQPRPGT